MYFPDTAVLITRFITENGVGEVVDFMPPSCREATDSHRLVRMVRCMRGEMSFAVDVAPRFDDGRAAHVTADRVRCGLRTAALTLTLHAVRERDDERLAHARVNDGDGFVSIDLTAGDVRGLVLESAADGRVRQRPADHQAQARADAGGRAV